MTVALIALASVFLTSPPAIRRGDDRSTGPRSAHARLIGMPGEQGCRHHPFRLAVRL